MSGKQAGGDEGSGTRSSLMYESIRIIGEVMPKVVIWENVKNLLSPKHRHNYDEYLKRLENLGYTNYYKVLNAKNYGIPQNRERIFTISILGDHKPFEFPKEIELTTKLIDLLETDVPDSFYISEEKIQKLLSKDIYKKHPSVLVDGTVSTICSRDYKDPKVIVEGCDTLAIKEATKKGYVLAGGGDTVNLEQPNSKTRRGRVGHGVAQTLTTSCNQAVVEEVETVNAYPDGTSRTIKAQYAKTSAANFVREGTYGATGAKKGLKIRKLTPKECWRLMGFSDDAYEKAAYMTEVDFIVGGEINKCNAKLKVVKEKQKQLDSDTYVQCTINELKDMELLKYTNTPTGIMTNVNIVIEKLEGLEHSECVTNTTKCFTFMGMQCILMQEKDQHHTDIIVLVKKDELNTELCMKITMESLLPKINVFTILILIKLIIESKIFGATTLKANIKGHIVTTISSENNILMQLSNLKMESIKSRNSKTSLYKQAGNSIVVNVLMEIVKQLMESVDI